MSNRKKLPPEDRAPQRPPVCPGGRDHVGDVDRITYPDVVLALIVYDDGCSAWRQRADVAHDTQAGLLHSFADHVATLKLTPDYEALVQITAEDRK